MNIKRVVTDLILFISILFLPWWMTVFVAIIATFYFGDFYEVLLVGLFFDFVYGPNLTKGFLSLHMTLYAFGLFVLAFYTRRGLKFYR